MAYLRSTVPGAVSRQPGDPRPMWYSPAYDELETMFANDDIDMDAWQGTNIAPALLQGVNIARSRRACKNCGDKPNKLFSVLIRTA